MVFNFCRLVKIFFKHFNCYIFLSWRFVSCEVFIGFSSLITIPSWELLSSTASPSCCSSSSLLQFNTSLKVFSPSFHNAVFTSYQYLSLTGLLPSKISLARVIMILFNFTDSFFWLPLLLPLHFYPPIAIILNLISANTRWWSLSTPALLISWHPRVISSFSTDGNMVNLVLSPMIVLHPCWRVLDRSNISNWRYKIRHWKVEWNWATHSSKLASNKDLISLGKKRVHLSALLYIKRILCQLSTWIQFF